MLDFVDFENSKTSIILANSFLKGNVTVKGDLQIDGNIVGDVDVEKFLRLNGQIEGNVKASNLIANKDSKLTGNVETLFDVKVIGYIKGNIKCSNIEVNGYVEGNIKATNEVVVKKGAIVKGDIICKDLTADIGATINGNVNLLCDILSLEESK